MILACSQCGGVVELALAGGATGIAVVLTHIWNTIRRHLHVKQHQE